MKSKAVAEVPLGQPEDMAAVHALMASAVGGGPGIVRDLYRWLRYHLGWSDADGRGGDSRSAKGLRPRLCLAACEAVGGDPSRAVAAAAAVELTHEFSLIHDDIQDRDRLRRGRRALWTVVGEAQAINLGDAMFALARTVLAEVPVPASALVAMYGRYDRACVELAEGQYLDLMYASAATGDTGEEPYLAMAERKTGALFGLAAALGAMAAETAVAAGPLDRFGRELGVAFQIADDILGLWGEPEVTGKPAGNDLLQGKRSYPVVCALEHPEIAGHVAGALASGDAVQAAEVSALMARAGLEETCRGVARRHAEAALSALEELDLAAAPRAALIGLATRATERSK